MGGTENGKKVWHLVVAGLVGGVVPGAGTVGYQSWQHDQMSQRLTRIELKQERMDRALLMLEIKGGFSAKLESSSEGLLPEG